MKSASLILFLYLGAAHGADVDGDGVADAVRAVSRCLPLLTTRSARLVQRSCEAFYTCLVREKPRLAPADPVGAVCSPPRLAAVTAATHKTRNAGRGRDVLRHHLWEPPG